jgi:hypothetical protein
MSVVLDSMQSKVTDIHRKCLDSLVYLQNSVTTASIRLNNIAKQFLEPVERPSITFQNNVAFPLKLNINMADLTDETPEFRSNEPDSRPTNCGSQ